MAAARQVTLVFERWLLYNWQHSKHIGKTTGINATSPTNGTTEATYFWNGRIKNVQSATASADIV